MEIYLDVVMIENFIINTFLLCVTIRLMKAKYTKRRIIAASFIGTIYTLVMIFPKLYFFSGLQFQLLVALIMMKIILNKCNYLFVVKGTLIFISVSLILSGLCFKISQIDQKYNLLSKVFKVDITSFQLIISIILLYVIVSVIYEYLKDRFVINGLVYDVEIELGNKEYCLKGFLDTGNSLTEPVTKLPCIIVEKKYLSNYEWIDSKFYYIPYSAIGSSGMLKGYKSDVVKIKGQDGKWKNIQAMVCPCNQVLSKCNDFNALLSRGII